MSITSVFLYPPTSINKKQLAEYLYNKTIVITGATFGIGESIAKYLFQYNVRLILVARTTEKLLALQQEGSRLHAEVIVFTCDFYDEKNLLQLCYNLYQYPIDYFISNAGKSTMRSLEESKTRIHDFKKTIAINYLAPVQLILNLIEQFSKSGTHIVNISTYNVLMSTPPKWSAYVSSKKAMHSWLQSNKPELALMNITLNQVYLPLVESRMKEANSSYKKTPAMPMENAVKIIIKSILYKNFDYKPWWHLPLQIMLILSSPFWNVTWVQLLKHKKY